MDGSVQRCSSVQGAEGFPPEVPSESRFAAKVCPRSSAIYTSGTEFGPDEARGRGGCSDEALTKRPREIQRGAPEIPCRVRFSAECSAGLSPRVQSRCRARFSSECRAPASAPRAEQPNGAVQRCMVQNAPDPTGNPSRATVHRCIGAEGCRTGALVQCSGSAGLDRRLGEAVQRSGAVHRAHGVCTKGDG